MNKQSVADVAGHQVTVKSMALNPSTAEFGHGRQVIANILYNRVSSNLRTMTTY